FEGYAFAARLCGEPAIAQAFAERASRLPAEPSTHAMAVAVAATVAVRRGRIAEAHHILTTASLSPEVREFYATKLFLSRSVPPDTTAFRLAWRQIRESIVPRGVTSFDPVVEFEGGAPLLSLALEATLAARLGDAQALQVACRGLADNGGSDLDR